MRTAAWLLIAIVPPWVASGGDARAAGGSTMKWTAVELSMQPRSGDPAPAWTVRLEANGTGMYSESGTLTAATMPLKVSEETLERIARGDRATKSGKCETKTKNIAKTGEKTIHYEADGRNAGCTFNYSDDAGLMDAAAAFQSIAQTVQEGERLKHEERYDRLALDAEMDTLLSAVRDGSAIEVPNIAPVLQSLVDDEHVIDRVRRKAARLLQDPASAAAAAGDDLRVR
jgi:hypothetical protein